MATNCVYTSSPYRTCYRSGQVCIMISAGNPSRKKFHATFADQTPTKQNKQFESRYRPNRKVSSTRGFFFLSGANVMAAVMPFRDGFFRFVRAPLLIARLDRASARHPRNFSSRRGQKSPGSDSGDLIEWLYLRRRANK